MGALKNNARHGGDKVGSIRRQKNRGGGVKGKAKGLQDPYSHQPTTIKTLKTKRRPGEKETQALAKKSGGGKILQRGRVSR